MTLVVAINRTDADHLAEVLAEMRVRGTPVLRAIRDEAAGVIVALEGSHRLAAAAQLGLIPVFKMLDEEDMILCVDLGYDDYGTFGGEAVRAGDIRDHIAGSMGMYSGCPMIAFDPV